MRAGQTRKSWDTGFNNVIPFPAVGIATWDILYAYQGDVAIDLGVVGDKHSDWAGKTFTIELKRYRQSREQLARRILGAEGHRRRRPGQERRVAAAAEAADREARSAKWLLLPVSIFGLLIATLIAWASEVRCNSAALRAVTRGRSVTGRARASSPS